MKQLIFLFNFIALTSNLIGQCYIQYTYDASGNRIKREYVGGCAKPGLTGDVVAVSLDTLQAVVAELRTELFRQDVEGYIRIYPNPTAGLFTIQLEHYSAEWTYVLRGLSGQLIRQGSISGEDISIDISTIPAADYTFRIYDAKGQIIYHTSIIKQ